MKVLKLISVFAVIASALYELAVIVGSLYNDGMPPSPYYLASIPFGPVYLLLSLILMALTFNADK